MPYIQAAGLFDGYVYCTFLLTWGNLFAKYYLSEYFRAFYKGKIILLTFPHSPSTDLAEFD